MIRIIKGKEPQALLSYRTNKWNPVEKQKIQPTYDGMPTEVKDEVKEHLLREQGYLCAYCMRRLSSVKKTKIEHWIAEKYLSEDEKLDYHNMLGVCYGKDENSDEKAYVGKEYEICDRHRGSDMLHIDPRLEKDMETIFYRSKDGTIWSSDEVLNNDLDKTLNLNCRAPFFLPENRKEVLEAVINKLNKTKVKNDGTWKKSLLFKLKRQYESKDKRGYLEPYAGIALWYLNKRLKRVQK